MSLPRRAMEQMGFSICCLNCDAPDIAGSHRCKVCIEKHSVTRERLTTGKAKTKAQRLAREMTSMLADPFSYIDDDIHGKWMLNYSEMIAEHQYNPEKTGQKRTVTRPRISRKRSLIREISNKNEWLENPPDEIQISEMRKILRGNESKQPMTWDDLISEIEEMLEE
ncbi:MAG: hypothetical protein CMA12_06660 [Euryarchaeota archaeon]|nr:hypothetical protein [Euryarchaeota archaeon]OUW22124.1 MAG: hypothetical protein CBD33_03620 [Euryarchaeota archaeon TMED173]|tara:strand:+ start:123 stop:623 length:501 start_codon:yes stop_codon:yes gene_type:complete